MMPIFGPSCITRVCYTAGVVKWRKDELKQWKDELETDACTSREGRRQRTGQHSRSREHGTAEIDTTAEVLIDNEPIINHQNNKLIC